MKQLVHFYFVLSQTQNTKFYCNTWQSKELCSWCLPPICDQYLKRIIISKEELVLYWFSLSRLFLHLYSKLIITLTFPSQQTMAVLQRSIWLTGGRSSILIFTDSCCQHTALSPQTNCNPGILLTNFLRLSMFLSLIAIMPTCTIEL